MDLTILVVIIAGTLASMLGLYFFLMKPLAGKSFEEIQKEKREMREKILGTGASASEKLKTSKDNANKKAKKGGNKKSQPPKQKAVKDSDLDSAEVESDSNASDSPLEEEINPLTYARKTINTSVEYAETEPFALSESHGKKKDKQQGQGKKNKQKGGILLNKSEPVLVKQESAPEINHFEESHPKDALEIARQHKEEEAKTKFQPKEQRKNKQKDHPKPSPKTSGVEEIAAAQVVAPVTANIPPVAEAKTVANKEKSNKKKKNELITQQLAEVQDVANVQSLVRILAKADMPRNDIQILIDFLLNKQQDTLAKDPSEWNDPSDPLQKLKKQLQDKETQLLEEQQAAASLQAKLKELRQELNNEKVQGGATLKSYNEELNAKRLEVQNLNQQLQLVSEKFTAEKQNISQQFQQLQTKYVQLNEKHAANQESAATIAQLNDNLQLLQHELMAKGQLLNEKLQIEEELLKKKTDYEILLHTKDELIQQRGQELAAYQNELQQLRVIANQKDELAKTCQQQGYELEQIKAQFSELQAKQKEAAAAAVAAVAANNQVEETSKVEIRNLQNALDSSKTELGLYRTAVAECQTKLADQEQLVKEMRAHKDELLKQIEEQKAKNNDLRMKNWKLVEALQLAQNNISVKQTGTNKNENSKVELSKNATNNHTPMLASEPSVNVEKVILEEQTRTKDLLFKLLPSDIVSALPLDATNFQSWLETTATCIREQLESSRKVVSTSSSTSTNTAPVSEVHTSNNNCNNNTSRSSNSNNNNSLHDNNDAHDGHDVEGNESRSKNGAPESDSDEDPQSLVLKNEQLQKTVDQYKCIIADTEIMLKNLETKVIEQDIHWRSVVQAKEKELTLIKSAGAMQ
ncbi:ribosome-binding protein 1 isoform X1 [Uranotaenia lowii]|uniref:ribosome-binding protein 1 isoform X1 n=1 Tax=Uranotaenia lowii TaxID=190385 RepID=UPI00247A2E41|nr:ribosome-binding protein 1 isoform X1 [Uranotaenia lowii]